MTRLAFEEQFAPGRPHQCWTFFSPRQCLAVALALVVSFAWARSAAALDFSSAKTYPVGTQPNAVVVGDFNGDDKPDLAVANPGSATVSILLNKGDGTFQSAMNVSVGNTPAAIVAGDFNRDGKLDLVVITQAAGVSTTSLFLGNGDGTFQSPLQINADPNARTLAAADLNLDGKLDLVIGNAGATPSLSVFLGNGDGSFQAPASYSLASGPNSIAAGDLNGDGKPDLVVIVSSKLEIFLGNGDGTLQALAPFSSFVVGSLLVGDFNRDNKLDLAALGGTFCIFNCRSNPSNVRILLGNGDGTFQAAGTYFISAGSPSRIAAGDFNHDGKLDLVAVSSASPLATILLNQGDGTFPTQLTFPIGSEPISVAVADLNGDQLPDLVTVNPNDNTVSVLLNTSVTSGADVALLGGAPSLVSGGPNLSYAFTVINEGPQDASNVTVTDRLPAGVSFASSTSSQGSCTQANLVVSCNLGSVVSGAQATVSVSFTPTASGMIVNSASVAATEPDLNMTNNGSTQSTQVFTLKVARSGSGSGTVASNGSTVINCGSTCTTVLPKATPVALLANPDSGSGFGGWGGVCASAGVATECDVTLNADLAATATFDPLPNFVLSVASTTLVMGTDTTIPDPVSITPEGTAFLSAVALTCAVNGPAPQPTCSLSPSSVTPGASPVTATLTINARSKSARLALPPDGRRLSLLFAICLPVPGIFFLGIGPASRKSKPRKLRLWLLGSLLLALFVVQAGCSGSSSSPPRTPTGTFTVTVTATSGAIQHSVPIALTVE
jgi:uncharacterized repeat protein (TIGR01451 family)